MKLRKFIREYLNENYHANELENILNKLNIDDFEILGSVFNRLAVTFAVS